MFDYGGGIYEDDACCNYPEPDCGYNINHAVAVVGYGTEAGQVKSVELNTAKYGKIQGPRVYMYMGLSFK